MREEKKAMRSGQLVILLLIILGGLVIRGLYMREFSRAPDFAHPAVDARFHDLWARSIAFDDAVTQDHGARQGIFDGPYLRPPGYPYFLALVYVLAGDGYLAPRIAQILLGLLSVLLAFFIGRRWYGGAEGLVFAGLMATHWLLIYFEGEFHAPSLLILLLLAAFYALGRWAETPKAGTALIVGLILGLAVITRPNALLLLPVLSVWFGWISWRRQDTKRTFISSTAALAAGLIIAVAPVTIRNAAVTGDFVPISTNGGINLYIGNNEHADGFVTGYLPGLGKFETCFDYPDVVSNLERKEGRPLSPSEVSSWFTGQALEFIRKQPGKFFKLTLKKAALFWGPEEITHNKVLALERENSRVLRHLPMGFPLLFTLAAMGFASILWRKRTHESGSFITLGSHEVTILTVLFIFAWFASVLPFFIAARYRVPILPFLMLFAAVGLCYLVRSLKAPDRKFTIILLTGGVLLYLLASVNLYDRQPDRVRWHMDRGRAYQRAGNQAKAFEEFNTALDLRPQDAEVHFSIATAMEAMGELSEAIDQYREAVRLHPGHTKALNNLGTLLARQGDYDGAIEVFMEALKTGQNQVSVHCNIGLAYEQSGRPREAVSHYRQALEYSPGNPRAKRGLKRALEAAGNTDVP